MINDTTFFFPVVLKKGNQEEVKPHWLGSGGVMVRSHGEALADHTDEQSEHTHTYLVTLVLGERVLGWILV